MVINMEGITIITKARRNGTSTVMTLKTEIKEYLDLKDGDIVEMGAYKGKKGKFIALWKKEE